MGLPYVARAIDSIRNHEVATWESSTVRGAMYGAEKHAKPSNRVSIRAAYTSDGSYHGPGRGRVMAYSEGSRNGKREWQVESHYDARTENHANSSRDPSKRSSVIVHVGRSGAGVKSVWASPDKRVAVVHTMHTPPRFVVFERGAGGWLKHDDFATLKAAIRSGRKLAHVSQKRVARDAGLDKKALHKTIDKDIAAAQKRKLNMLRGELKVAFNAERKACGLARMSSQARIQSLRARRKRLQELIKRLIVKERVMRKETCSARPRVSAAKKALADERSYQASLKRSATAARMKSRPGLRGTRATRRSESDDEVRHNIPPHLHGLWKRLKSGIRATPRMSRTEAFMKYVEEHPREEFADADDATDALIADLERQNRAGRRDMNVRGSRGSGRDASRNYRVAYHSGSSGNYGAKYVSYVNGYYTLDQAKKHRQTLENRGKSAWVETRTGGFVPVEGAKHKPAA